MLIQSFHSSTWNPWELPFFWSKCQPFSHSFQDPWQRGSIQLSGIISDHLLTYNPRFFHNHVVIHTSWLMLINWLIFWKAIPTVSTVALPRKPLFICQRPVQAEWNYFSSVVLYNLVILLNVTWQTVFMPPYAKSWLVGKDPDAGRDWGQEEKGMTEDEMAGWHHRLDGHGFE